MLRSTPEPAPFPLLEPGQYYAGKLNYAFEDASRDSRPVGITVWYPAVQPEGSSGTKLQVGADRDPDRSGAPYPLILSRPKWPLSSRPIWSVTVSSGPASMESTPTIR